MTNLTPRGFVVLLMMACGMQVCAQDGANLIPNPGFEEYSGTPLGWFFTGKDFTRVMKYWESPSAASPDIYGAKVRVPSQWKSKGFGQTDPRSGKSMVGITVYGCEGGKPHCREYLQTQLNEVLVIGQRYRIQAWAKPLEHSLRIDRLGFYFSEDRISSLTDEVLNFNPQIISSGIDGKGGSSWFSIGGEFHAETEANYILIGNFSPDEVTVTKLPGGNPLGYGYYYIDDILLEKLEPILEVPVKPDDLSRLALRKGQVVNLKNIYFDHDKAEFLPRSYQELDKLADRMQEHPGMMIEIQGHTDNVGTAEYNRELSVNRAKAVVDYLIAKGIDPDRLRYKGYGSTTPVASNATEYGRQMNRRVEFLILKYD